MTSKFLWIIGSLFLVAAISSCKKETNFIGPPPTSAEPAQTVVQPTPAVTAPPSQKPTTSKTTTQAKTPATNVIVVSPPSVKTQPQQQQQLTPNQLHRAVARPVRRGAAAVIIYDKNNP